MSDTIDPKLHSVIVNLELFILGDINKFMEIDERPDPEYGGKSGQNGWI